MGVQLRDYQVEMLDRLEKAWARYRSVMVQMPTGTGKTHLMAEVIRRELRVKNLELRGVASRVGSKNSELFSGTSHVLIVAHRRELLDQIRGTVRHFGIDMEENHIVVESIQKLARESLPQTLSQGERDWNPTLVIIDEAHHALAKTYRMLWERWPKARFLGLTATPCRLNNAPFTDLFQTLLQSYSIQEFIDRGWLSDFEYVSASPESAELRRVASLRKRGVDGDYQQKELVTVMDVPESIEHLYDTYHQFADGKKGIVYAINREHARHIVEYYRVHGVNCCLIDSKTPAEERRRMVEAFKHAGDGLRVLVNVDIFGEGFDVPEVEFIQLARPTLSLSKYLQQVGRGMRVSKGKPQVLIIDNVGLYQTFGLPTEEREWRQMFYGRLSGKGDASTGRYVVLDDSRQEKELVNLEMVCIKKGGQKNAGLEIFLKNGRYGVINGSKVTCMPRFKKIVKLEDTSGYFAAGIYGGKQNDIYVEYASLIDRKGIDLKLRLYRDVKWKGGYFYSCYKRPGYKGDDYSWSVYWDPKGNCYYDYDPEFQMVCGVEVAYASEHTRPDELCYKLRKSTGMVSPRFKYQDIFYNRNVIVARDYLIVKKDHNHAYQICAFLSDSVLVRQESDYGFQQIFMDGRKGECFRHIPPDAKRSILQVQLLGLKRAY